MTKAKTKRTKTKATRQGGKVTAIYERVSSQNQKHDSQEHDIKQYVKAKGHKSLKWYRDKISGVAPTFPAMKQLDKDVLLGKVERIVFWNLDRVSRKGPRDGLNVIGNWIDHGVTVVCLQFPWPMEGPMGQGMLAIGFAVANMEHTTLKARIKAGVAARQAKGLPHGRPKGCKSKWNLSKRKVDSQLAKSLRSQGIPVRAIAKRFHCSAPSVYAALKVETK